MSTGSFFRPIAPLLLSAALAACVVAPGGSPPVDAPVKVKAAATAKPGHAVIAGRVLAPPGLVAAGGGNVIVNNTGNAVSHEADGILSHNGAALVAAGGLGLRLLAVEERPLAGTEVFLADSAGSPLPGRKPVQTAADGSYTFTDAPAEMAVVVAARARTADGRAAVLQTIAKPSAQGAMADVSGASTMVAASLVSGRPNALETFNPAAFATATAATARNLELADLPDFADRAAVVRRMNELAARISEIQAALDDLRKELAEIKASLADLKTLIASLGEAPTVAGSPPSGTAPSSGPRPPAPAAGCEGVFGYLDADADGGVTLAEWSARFRGGPGEPPAGEVFGFIDADRDGRLTAAEFVPACEAHGGADRPPAPGTGPGPQGPGGTPDCDSVFAHFDRDRDGRVTEAEWRDAPPGPDGGKPPLDHFGRLDGDRNGFLGKREFAPMCEPREPPLGR